MSSATEDAPPFSELQTAQGYAADHRPLREEEEDYGWNGENERIGENAAEVGYTMVQHELVDTEGESEVAGIVEENQGVKKVVIRPEEGEECGGSEGGLDQG